MLFFSRYLSDDLPHVHPGYHLLEGLFARVQAPFIHLIIAKNTLQYVFYTYWQESSKRFFWLHFLYVKILLSSPHSYCVYFYSLCARFLLESWLFHPKLQRVLTDIWRTRLSRCHMIGLLPHPLPPHVSKLDQRRSGRPRESTYWRERWGGGGIGQGAKSKSYDARNLVLKYDSILSADMVPGGALQLSHRLASHHELAE